MPDPLSLNVQHLKASETVAISNEAKRRKAAGEDVLDLGVGEPDFDTPAPAAQAGIQADPEGADPLPAQRRHRGAAQGHRAEHEPDVGRAAHRPRQIVVSSGSKQSIFNACFTLFGPKDRVLIPAPAWVSYPQIVHLCRAEPVLVPGDLEWGLKVSAKDLDRASNKLTRGLILCSPCNPDRRGVHAGRAAVDRRVGQGQRRLDHLGRDLPPHQLRSRARRRRCSTCPTICSSAP